MSINSGCMSFMSYVRHHFTDDFLNCYVSPIGAIAHFRLLLKYDDHASFQFVMNCIRRAYLLDDWMQILRRLLPGDLLTLSEEVLVYFKF